MIYETSLMHIYDVGLLTALEQGSERHAYGSV